MGDLMLFLMLLSIYLLPGYVASSRNHQQSLAIWVLTIVGGWTMLGWIVALVWACTNTLPGGKSANQAQL